MILNRPQIEKLITSKKLVEGFIDLKIQLTPNGIDITVAEVFSFVGAGALDFSNKERIISEVKPLTPEKLNPQDRFGWWKLAPGAYKVRTNETFNMPHDLAALAFTRSSLLRCGVFIQNAVWDAGFCGKAEFILVVQNPFGFRLKQNARLIQLVFLKMRKTDEGYNGIYQERPTRSKIRPRRST